MSKRNAIVFGSTGSIGSYIKEQLEKENINVIGTTSVKEKENKNTIYVTNNELENLNKAKNTHIVVWAQGFNYNDSIFTFTNTTFLQMVEGNISFILNTMNYLLNEKIVEEGCKMVIISSIWEELTRDNKLSYSITKSALSGLVKNTAYDLSKMNILINNVLPGVIDNEMTRKTLSEEQLHYITKYTFFDRLITLEDVYRTVRFLVIENTGITGQSIKVDLGFTNVKKYN
jgi:NAD(P)-dependent dehydrogenase (short-subunit alcohol dehydrogenase family)